MIDEQELAAAIQEQLDAGVDETDVELQVLHAFIERYGIVEGSERYQEDWQARQREEICRALFPTCGLYRGIFRPRATRIPRSAWRFPRDPNKPFGIINSSEGRG